MHNTLFLVANREQFYIVFLAVFRQRLQLQLVLWATGIQCQTAGRDAVIHSRESAVRTAHFAAFFVQPGKSLG